jgi:hypothetical protein
MIGTYLYWTRKQNNPYPEWSEFIF